MVGAVASGRPYDAVPVACLANSLVSLLREPLGAQGHRRAHDGRPGRTAAASDLPLARRALGGARRGRKCAFQWRRRRELGKRSRACACNGADLHPHLHGDVFERSLKQERQVSQQIDALYELAFQEKAFSALVELEWFITEQVEEEKTAREIVHKFHLLKDDAASLLDLDRELGSRTTAALKPGP